MFSLWKSQKVLKFYRNNLHISKQIFLVLTIIKINQYCYQRLYFIMMNYEILGEYKNIEFQI